MSSSTLARKRHLNNLTGKTGIPDVATTGTINTRGLSGGYCALTITTGAETRTLASPTAPNQTLLLFCETNDGTSVAVTHGDSLFFDEAGTTALTFSAVGEFVKLESVTTAGNVWSWRIIGYDGVDGPTLDISDLTADTLSLSSTLGVTGVTTPTGGVAASGGFAAKATSVHSGGKPAASATDGSDTTIGATTEVNACECFVPCNMTVTGISVLNGPTVTTDKLVLILHDSAGAVIANTALAGTTTSGVDSYQRIAFTAPLTVLGPATYHIAVTVDGTTDNHHTHAFGDFACGTHTGHTFGTAAAITPDTTFTAGDGPIASLY
jgi:hypothetical protein